MRLPFFICRKGNPVAAGLGTFITQETGFDLLGLQIDFGGNRAPHGGINSPERIIVSNTNGEKIGIIQITNNEAKLAGRAVLCPPPSANERILIHHDGRMGVFWGAHPPRVQFSAPSRKTPGA